MRCCFLRAKRIAGGLGGIRAGHERTKYFFNYTLARAPLRDKSLYSGARPAADSLSQSRTQQTAESRAKEMRHHVKTRARTDNRKKKTKKKPIRLIRRDPNLRLLFARERAAKKRAHQQNAISAATQWNHLFISHCSALSCLIALPNAIALLLSNRVLWPAETERANVLEDCFP